MIILARKIIVEGEEHSLQYVETEEREGKTIILKMQPFDRERPFCRYITQTLYAKKDKTNSQFLQLIYI
ncbi:MAG: hypothetical protein NC097_05820 [Clostridium sp.]|nr:hypothetical protein [Prevotella sp.]MCM1429296.1 hypothetical protein [Clostridium sp.]MCM1475671.1 hypothetical protein [Muribaculaceae bacterium]